MAISYHGMQTLEYIHKKLHHGTHGTTMAPSRSMEVNQLYPNGISEKYPLSPTVQDHFPFPNCGPAKSGTTKRMVAKSLEKSWDVYHRPQLVQDFYDFAGPSTGLSNHHPILSPRYIPMISSLLVHDTAWIIGIPNDD